MCAAMTDLRVGSPQYNVKHASITHLRCSWSATEIAVVNTEQQEIQAILLTTPLQGNNSHNTCPLRWLEEELARRYRDAAPATLALLQERCEGAAAELVAAESRLQAAEDVTSLRRAGNSCHLSRTQKHTYSAVHNFTS